MSSNQGLLEQVLQEARSRAEEIRIEIATLKEKTGSSSTVTVPQLLKGDAVPDVTEPEGKLDDPESSLQYNISTPSGERQAPPKTEDGTDTEEQQERPATYKGDGRLLDAENHVWATAVPAAHETDSFGTNSQLLVSLVAGDDNNSSWQGVYRDVLSKLNQSRSFRQHFASGSEIANLLQEAGLAGSPNSIAISLHQLATPFAGDTCQAAAIAAGAITSDNCQPAAAVRGMTHMLTPSPLHVVESPCRISCTPAALQQKHNWGGDHASSGNSSSTDLAADGVATGSAASSENGLARGAPGSCRLPLIMPASAADLPVQAVLKELDELLAWQTSRSPAAHQSAQGSAAAHVTAGNADAAADNVIRAASQHLDEKEEEGDRSLVTQWLQATQQQHSALCRGNSASWAASEDSFYMSGLNSNSSTLRPMRRSNSMPTGHSQGPASTDGEVAESDSTPSHSHKTGSTGLKEDIISHLKLAAAFHPVTASSSQHIADAALFVPAEAVDGQVQQGASVMGWLGVDRVLSDLPNSAAVDNTASGSKANRSYGTPPRQHHPAATDLCMPSNLPSIRTGRSSSPAAVSAASSPAAALNSNYQSLSRPALLYQQLLQGQRGDGSSSGSPKSAGASKQPRGSPKAAGTGSNGKAPRRHTGDHQSAAAGASTPQDQQHHQALAGHCKVTCSACGSPVVAKATPLSAGSAHPEDAAVTTGVKPPAIAAAAADGHSADCSIAESTTACEVLEARLDSVAEVGEPNSPLGCSVAFASLSISTLLNHGHRPGTSRRTAGPADSGACNSSPASPRRAAAASSSYSSRAATRKAMAGSMATNSPHGVPNRRTAASAAAASPKNTLLGACSAAEFGKGGYASSAGKQVSRMQAATGAVCSSSQGAMATSVSCGQLLQEAALHRATSRVSGCTGDAPTALHGNAQHQLEEQAAQQSQLCLGALRNDRVESAAHNSRRVSTGALQGPEVVSVAKGGGAGGPGMSSGIVAYRLQPTNEPACTSPAAAAAASAALQALALGANRRDASASRRATAASDTTDKHTRGNSAGAASDIRGSPGVSRSSSTRSRMSASSSASGGSQRVWRPGGQRTSAKDDCRKLQAYESARRALMGTSGSSPGRASVEDSCSSTNSNNNNKSAAAAKHTGSPHKVTTASLRKSGARGAGQATVNAVKAGPAAMTAQVQASTADRAPVLAVAEQGVQANMVVAAGTVSASSLIDELRHKSQPNDRQTSPGRLQHLKPSGTANPAAAAAAAVPLLPHKASMADPPVGHSSSATEQVEQAIHAAQVALLQRRWQISQMRKAIQQHGIAAAGVVSNGSSPPHLAVGCRITAGSKAAAASGWQLPCNEAVTEQANDDGMPGDLAATSAASWVAAGTAAEGEDQHHEFSDIDNGLCAVQPAARAVATTLQHSEYDASAGKAVAQASTAEQPYTTSSCYAAAHMSCTVTAARRHVSPATHGSPAGLTTASRPFSSSPKVNHVGCISPFAADAHRSVSSGGSGAAAVSPPAWSAPRRVSSSGMSGQELIQFYRRSSAAETAEAAAAAAEAGAAVGSTVPGAMNLDAMLRAYNVLSKRKSSGDKAAALTSFMANVVTVGGVQDCHLGSSSSHQGACNCWDVIQEDSCHEGSSHTVLYQNAPDDGSGPTADAAGCHISQVVGPATAVDVPADALAAATAEGSGLVIVHKAQPVPMGSVKLCDTATGRAVLSGISDNTLTAQQAVQWLQAGLTRIPSTASGGGAVPGLEQQLPRALVQGKAGAASSRPVSPDRPASPSKVRSYSRPCSPFRCFSAVGDLSDDEEVDGCQQLGPTSKGQVQQQLQDDVHFEMDEFSQLMMVVPQHMSGPGSPAHTTRGLNRYQVTGVSLCDDSSPSSTAESTAGHTLELITCVGRHRIALASRTDWAGLLAGLNSMLLLHEANGATKQIKDNWEGVPVSDIPWSSAVEGVQV